MSPAESADLDHDGFPLGMHGQDPDGRKNWFDRPWMWPIFGLIGLLVFELTTSSGLAVAVFCVKLGMGDVRLGLWLARNDPNRERGTITGLMAASLIGIKITLASLVILVVLFVLALVIDPNAGQNQVVIGQCARSLGITTAVALCVSLAIARLGFYQARRAGLKVWLESSMRRAPVQHVWPLDCIGHTQRNMVIDVAQFCFLLQIPLIMAATTLISLLIERLVPNAMVWGIVVGLLLQILSYIHLRTTIWKVAALHPGECWPELLKTHQFRYFDGVKYRRATRLEDDSCWEENEGDD